MQPDPLIEHAFRHHAHAVPTVVAVRGLSVDGTRHDASVRRAWDDVLIAYGPGRRTAVLPMTTHPWQYEANRPRALASELPPGRYVASPVKMTRKGRLSPEGRPCFTLAHPDGTPVQNSQGLGYGLYSGPDCDAHIGCQAVKAEHWDEFLRVIGGLGQRFDYVLVDARRRKAAV